MYKAIILITLLSSPAIANNDPTIKFEQDAYGLGAHSDQYGRVYKTDPGVQLKQNTYGPGRHSDQYGRPVTPEPVNRRKSWGR